MPTDNRLTPPALSTDIISSESPVADVSTLISAPGAMENALCSPASTSRICVGESDVGVPPPKFTASIGAAMYG